MEKNKKTVSYIDAANLFYSGKDALTWKVDYENLFKYLKERYGAEMLCYFGGLEIYGFPYDQILNETLPLEELKNYLDGLIKRSHELTKKERFALLEHPLKAISVTISRIKFYQKLEGFGYKLNIKPIKTYYNGDEPPRRKRNCDVDMTFSIMKDENKFERYLILSGDGDFLPVVKYLRSCGKEVLILARGIKTAKEIKQFAGDTFLEFDNLREFLEQKEDSGDTNDDGL